MTDAKTLLQEGLTAFRARAYDEALQAWRALLDQQPNNTQVQELVERTEILAAEGHLVQQLKEQMADLREELATTRQARNELLIEMARMHQRYQQREAKMWRLQEVREWELREALAQSELFQLGVTEAIPSDLSIEDALQDVPTADGQSDEAYKNALKRAQEQIRTLQNALRTHVLQSPPNTPAPSPTPVSDRQADTETAHAKKDSQNAATKDTAIKENAPPKKPAAAPPASDGAHDAPAAAAHNQTHPSRFISDEDLNTEPPDLAAPTIQKSSETNTQNTHTVPPDEPETKPQDTAADFEGPLISEQWLQDDQKAHTPPPTTHRDPAAPTNPHRPRHPRTATHNIPRDIISTDLDTNNHDKVSEEHAPIPDTLVSLISEDRTRPDKIDAASEPALSKPQTEEILPDDALENAANDEPSASAEAQSLSSTDDESFATESKNIPDTAKIKIDPDDDRNISDGFNDELTNALGSTPAPPRLFTGVQPELPDIDILDDEPDPMPPEDLDRFPTSIPVRHKDNPDIEDPIAQYLLTHVDGVSTFMELRGTVGLPPQHVDRGFRILLAHDVIRVKHQ